MADEGKIIEVKRREVDTEEKLAIAISDMEHVMDGIDTIARMIQREVYGLMPDDIFLKQWEADDMMAFAGIRYHTKFVRDQLLVRLHEMRGRKL